MILLLGTLSSNMAAAAACVTRNVPYNERYIINGRCITSKACFIIGCKFHCSTPNKPIQYLKVNIHHSIPAVFIHFEQEVISCDSS